MRNGPQKVTQGLFRYSELIRLAILHSPNNRATLSEIYTWIRENFKYYRECDAGWRVSEVLYTSSFAIKKAGVTLTTNYKSGIQDTTIVGWCK